MASTTITLLLILGGTICSVVSSWAANPGEIVVPVKAKRAVKDFGNQETDPGY